MQVILKSTQCSTSSKASTHSFTCLLAKEPQCTFLKLKAWSPLAPTWKFNCWQPAKCPYSYSRDEVLGKSCRFL